MHTARVLGVLALSALMVTALYGVACCDDGPKALEERAVRWPAAPVQIGEHSCEVSPTSFSLVGNGSMGMMRSVQITNTGDYVFEGVVEMVTSCPYFELMSGGSYSIAPGDFHIFQVGFQTIECDTFYCRIKTGAQDVHVTGMGEGAGCSMAGPDPDFGEVFIGSYADKEFWFTNENCVDINLNVADYGDANFRITAGEGPVTLAPWESHRVTIRFEPVEVGPLDALFAIGYGMGDCNWLQVTGTGADVGCALRLAASGAGGGIRATYWLDADGPVTLKVYDAAGRLVRTLINDTRPAGRYEQAWDLANESGRRVTAGVYFFALEQGGRMRVEKTMVLR